VANAAELREEVMKQKFEASFGGRARSGEGEKKTGSAEGGGHAAGGGAVEALPGGLPGRPDGAHGHRAPGVGAQARAPGGARVGDGAMCVFVCVCVRARVCVCVRVQLSVCMQSTSGPFRKSPHKQLQSLQHAAHAACRSMWFLPRAMH